MKIEQKQQKIEKNKGENTKIQKKKNREKT